MATEHKVVTIKLPKFNLWMAATVILAIALVAVVFYGDKLPLSANIVKSSVPKDTAVANALNYINVYLLSSGQKATLVSSEELPYIYKMNIQIGTNTYESYVTKDGNLLFPSGAIDLAQTPETTTVEPAQTCADLTKADAPLLQAFIVSNCPYGLQMQRILAEFAKSYSGNIEVRYLGSVSNGKITSMHGDTEATENLRQICIREEQSAKYWDYVSCYIKKGDSASCIVSTGLDTAKLDSCMTDPAKGLAYAQEDFTLSNQYQVTGSPTLILNGETVSEFDFGGRTAEAVKTLLCCGFTTEPASCSQALSTGQAASGFSETYSSSTGAASAASCG